MSGEASPASYSGTTVQVPESFEGAGAVLGEQSTDEQLLAEELAKQIRMVKMLQELQAAQEESARLVAVLGPRFGAGGAVLGPITTQYHGAGGGNLGFGASFPPQVPSQASTFYAGGGNRYSSSQPQSQVDSFSVNPRLYGSSQVQVGKLESEGRGGGHGAGGTPPLHTGITDRIPMPMLEAQDGQSSVASAIQSGGEDQSRARARREFGQLESMSNGSGNDMFTTAVQGHPSSRSSRALSGSEEGSHHDDLESDGHHGEHGPAILSRQSGEQYMDWALRAGLHGQEQLALTEAKFRAQVAAEVEQRLQAERAGNPSLGETPSAKAFKDGSRDRAPDPGNEPKTATIVVVLSAMGDVLLTRGTDLGHYCKKENQKLQLPGVAHQGSETVEEAAARALVKETNLKAKEGETPVIFASYRKQFNRSDWIIAIAYYELKQLQPQAEQEIPLNYTTSWEKFTQHIAHVDQRSHGVRYAHVSVPLLRKLLDKQKAQSNRMPANQVISSALLPPGSDLGGMADAIGKLFPMMLAQYKQELITYYPGPKIEKVGGKLSVFDAVLPMFLFEHWRQDICSFETTVLPLIVSHAEACKLDLLLMAKYAPDELNQMTQTILNHIPSDFTFEEADKYEGD